jgi:hypothetical protein
VLFRSTSANTVVVFADGFLSWYFKFNRPVVNIKGVPRSGQTLYCTGYVPVEKRQQPGWL